MHIGYKNERSASCSKKYFLATTGLAKKSRILPSRLIGVADSFLKKTYGFAMNMINSLVLIMVSVEMNQLDNWPHSGVGGGGGGGHPI